MKDNMIAIDPDSINCGLAEEGAALGLLGMMLGLSEEFWCAGWETGTEHALWRVEAGTHWGQGEITERQATLLRLLSEECDGWWEWSDGPKFIRREAWTQKLLNTAP